MVLNCTRLNATPPRSVAVCMLNQSRGLPHPPGLPWGLWVYQSLSLEELEIGTSFTASLHVDEASSHLNMSKRPDAGLRNIKRQEKCINTNAPKFFVIAILTVFFVHEHHHQLRVSGTRS